MEVGSVVIDGEERDAEDVLKDSIAEIDQSLQHLAQMEDLKVQETNRRSRSNANRLQEYVAESSMDETVAWMHSAMDALLEKVDHCLAQE